MRTYFTAGPKEIRAWTYRSGWLAPKCAGVIHSDFERGFIRVEVAKFKDLVEAGSEKAVKAAGKAYLKGRDYIIEDGDLSEWPFAPIVVCQFVRVRLVRGPEDLLQKFAVEQWCYN